MSQIHFERLAWDSARVVLATIEAGTWPWLAYEIGERIESDLRDRVIDSFTRVSAGPERRNAEAGLWRATLTDLLIARPAVGERLVALMDEARSGIAPIAA